MLFFYFFTRFFPNHYRPRSVCLRCLDGLFYLLYYGILLPKKVHFLFYFFTSLIFSLIQTFKEIIFLHKTARSCVCLADRPLLLPSIVGGEAPYRKKHVPFILFRLLYKLARLSESPPSTQYVDNEAANAFRIVLFGTGIGIPGRRLL